MFVMNLLLLALHPVIFPNPGVERIFIDPEVTGSLGNGLLGLDCQLHRTFFEFGGILVHRRLTHRTHLVCCVSSWSPCVRKSIATSHLHQHPLRGVTPSGASAYPTLRAAPSGNSPVSSKRHSAMSNLRATATIPIRRKRLPPWPKRSRNHTLRALSGCKRSQLYANSVVIQRTCRLPDL